MMALAISRAHWLLISNSSPEWRPFAGGLSPRSIAYALSVLGALYRWPMQQRYVLANPFAGIKVRGASKTAACAPANWLAPGLG